MFADCIETAIHPATWAVVGFRRDLAGFQASQRGTAFAIDANGHLLTCWHVTFMDQDCTEDPDYLEVLQPEVSTTRTFRARLVARDKDRDLALLKIEDDSCQTSGAQLISEGRVAWGTSCCAFGHPLSAATKDGIRIFTRAAAGVLSMPYSAPRFPGCRPIKLYEVDFFTHGGISGGPLFLPDGRVFGVISGSRLLDQDGSGQPARSNLSVAIDVSEVIEFVEPHRVKLQLTGHVRRNIVAKIAQHFRTLLPGRSRDR